jgi:hypothetical protein
MVGPNKNRRLRRRRNPGSQELIQRKERASKIISRSYSMINHA